MTQQSTEQTTEQATAQTPDAQPETTPEAQADEWKNKALVLAAEMENLRKRTQKDVADARSFAVTNFAKDLLSVADNMEHALKAIQQAETSETAENIKPLKDGVAMVSHQLTQVFTRNNIEKFNSQGETMDPEKHQVMAQVESDQPANTVVEVMQQGYTLSGRLLRPALVSVSKGGK